jgi:hypothetical protein
MADQTPDPYAATAIRLTPRKAGGVRPASAPASDPYAATALATPSSAASPPDLTTNTIDPATGHGYGLYPMTGPGGTTHQIPFNQVANAQRQGLTLDYRNSMRYRDDLRAAQPEQPFLPPNESRNQWISPVEFGKGGLSAVYSMIRHPIDTMAAMGQPFAATGMAPGGMYPTTAPTGSLARDQQNQAVQSDALRQQGEQGKFMATHPAYAAGGAVIPALLTHGLTKIPGVAESAMRFATDTGKAPVQRAVAETLTANQNIDTANAKAAQSHLADTQEALHETRGRELQYQQAVKSAADEAQAKTAEARRQYIEQRRAIEASNQQAEATRQKSLAQQANIGPRRAQLQAAWRTLLAGIETARARALKIGNAKYSGVNGVLNKYEANPETMQNVLLGATEQIKGTSTEPAIIKDMMRKSQLGEVPTYEDLQGYYSELGKELSKGTLPGDIYHAYDTLHEAIGGEMQRIANEHGQGEALYDARNYWRRMKQTFGKPFSASDAATKTLKTSAPDIASADEQANRIRLLGSFDPRIPQVFNHIQNIQKGIEALPGEQTPRQIVQKFAESYKSPGSISRPGVVEPTPVKPVERIAPPDRPMPQPPKTLSAADLQQAREKALVARRDWMLHRGMWVATWPVFQAMRAIWGGHIPRLPGMALESGGTLATVKATTELMKYPPMLRFLTQARPEDVRLIPPEMRGDLSGLVSLAQRQGIRVSPALVAGATGAVAAGSAGAGGAAGAAVGAGIQPDQQGTQQ